MPLTPTQMRTLAVYAYESTCSLPSNLLIVAKTPAGPTVGNGVFLTRIAVSDASGSVSDADLASVDWGDGTIDVQTEHAYASVERDHVVITVDASRGRHGVSAPFSIIAA